MAVVTYTLTAVLTVLAFVPAFECATDNPASHLKPFGWGKSIQLEEIQNFPPVKQFFEGKIQCITLNKTG